MSNNVKADSKENLKDSVQDNLKLEKQLCFRLYRLSKTLNKLYAPLLKALSLTYPQYLVMLYLWDNKEAQTIKAIGQALDLDTGTLSPLLKRIEKMALITRKRSDQDERIVSIKLTTEGQTLKAKAEHIPAQLFALTGLSYQEMLTLQASLDTLLEQTQKHL
jgi:DNA-binding MarR family transcriptional regulator